MKRATTLYILLACLFAGCTELTTGGGYNPPPTYGGYNSPSYGGYNSPRDDYYQRQIDQEQRREWREIERERARVEAEREAWERQQKQPPTYSPPPPPPPPPPAAMSCPAGFSPSERRCSDAERRRGCRDIRLPNGMGCVSR